MKMNLKHFAPALAVAVGVALSGISAQAGAGMPGAGMPGAGMPGAGMPGAGMPQDHDQAQAPDYSKNKNYQQGMREGHSDHDRNLDHSKKRHFKRDEDQKAYEAGYQKGHGN